MAKLNTKIVMLKGEQGKDGTNIKSVEKSASDGLTDTYQGINNNIHDKRIVLLKK